MVKTYIWHSSKSIRKKIPKMTAGPLQISQREKNMLISFLKVTAVEKVPKYVFNIKIYKYLCVHIFIEIFL